MRSGEELRGLAYARALVLSWLAVAASVAAHLSASSGAPAPGLGVMAVTVVALGLVSAPLFRTRLSLWRSGPALLVQQLVAHVVLSVASGASAVSPSPRLTAALGGGHSSADASAAPHQAMTGGAGGMDHSVLPSPTMLAAHAVVALALGCALASAERSWWTISALQRAWATVVTVVASLGPARLLVRCVRPPATQAGFARVARLGHLLPAPLADPWRAPCPLRRGPPSLLGS